MVAWGTQTRYRGGFNTPRGDLASWICQPELLQAVQTWGGRQICQAACPRTLATAPSQQRFIFLPHWLN